MTVKKSSYKKRASKLLVAVPPKKVRLAIVCTPEERKLMKMRASYEEKSLNDFVMECVRPKITHCKRTHVPNEETAKALDASERGEGLRSHDSIDAMFKFLGI